MATREAEILEAALQLGTILAEIAKEQTAQRGYFQPESGLYTLAQQIIRDLGYDWSVYTTRTYVLQLLWDWGVVRQVRRGLGKYVLYPENIPAHLRESSPKSDVMQTPQENQLLGGYTRSVRAAAEHMNRQQLVRLEQQLLLLLAFVRKKLANE